MDFHQPRSLDEATTILSRQDCLLMAGGTDIYPAHATKPLSRPILDVSRIVGLRGIHEDEAAFHFGACTTWSDVTTASLPPAFDGLKQAAREVGSIQIQNRASIAGNICNASPAADGVPPLLTLDAFVTLTSSRGTRRLALQDFILGNRKTARARDEIMTAIAVPKSSVYGRSAFRKLGVRRYLVISIAMLAVRLATGADGRITTCAVAVGACSPVALRLRRLEQTLLGQDPRKPAFGPEVLDQLSPIDDVRSSAAYRRHAVRELILRTLRDAA
jgi:CO/xanthine dehydrogenase FAD-binding subunit